MPQVPLHCSDTFSEGAGSATRNFRLAAGGIISSSAVEANRQILYRTPGILSKIYTNVLTNDHTGATTVRVRKNSADGNGVLSIPATTTGEFEDTTNTDTIAAGDLINYRFSIGAGGTTFTLRNNRAIFKASSGETVTQLGNGAAVVTATDVFPPVMGSSGSVGVEANNQHKIPFAATWRNFGVYVNANTRDANVTYRTRVNTANGNQSVNIITLTTGWFEDTVNTDSLAAADIINYQGVTAGTAGTVTVNGAKSEIVTSSGKFLIGGCENQTQNQNVTNYWAIGGAQVASGTESNNQVKAGMKYTASNLGVYVSANGVTAVSTLKLRKNGANGNQSVSIAASTTGFFIDAVNIDKIAATDLLCLQLITGAGGTSLTTRTFQMQGQVARTGSNLLLMGIA